MENDVQTYSADIQNAMDKTMKVQKRQDALSYKIDKISAEKLAETIEVGFIVYDDTDCRHILRILASLYKSHYISPILKGLGISSLIILYL